MHSGGVLRNLIQNRYNAGNQNLFYTRLVSCRSGLGGLAKPVLPKHSLKPRTVRRARMMRRFVTFVVDDTDASTDT